MSARHTGRRGFVLLVVIFFIVLLTSALATFLRRATMDAAIVKNRDQAAQAEALARGGVRLATALLLQDRVEEASTGLGVETGFDAWALVAGVPIEAADGGTLHLRIRDAASLLDLNALVQEGEPVDGAEAFLQDFLEKVIDEMPGRPEEKLYDRDELVGSLLDFLDADDVTPRGELEDEWYQQQDPPARAANRPLLSVDELALVRGFDGALVDALRPYVTVYPWTGGGGPNPNTAPAWVLASMHVGAATDRRLPSEDDVRRFLSLRADGPLCAGHELCIDLTEAGNEGLFLEYTLQSELFLVESQGAVGGVTRTIETVLDRSEPAEPRILAWRVR